MRVAIIENGRVANLEDVADDCPIGGDVVPAPEGANAGDKYDVATGEFTPPARVRFAVVESGVVENIVDADEFFGASQGWPHAANGVDIGYEYDAVSGLFSPPPLPPFDRQAAVREIDDAVAAVYGRFTRFQPEYEERERQAQAFKDAGYSGDVPQQVAAFAGPAAMSAQDATDLILQQAAQLRGARDQLGVQRMRKYEVLREADDAAARASHADILAEVGAIAEALA